jgi:6-phosphofructo-2-kinase/fructose-2,6-biphosphatase
LKRTADTVKYLRKIPKVYWRVLDELDAGNCDGMTYEQVSREMPEEYEARQRDKLRYALALNQTMHGWYTYSPTATEPREGFQKASFKALTLPTPRYRYPRGESYLDVIQRLESVIVELERQSAPVLVIAHQVMVAQLLWPVLPTPACLVLHACHPASLCLPRAVL